MIFESLVISSLIVLEDPFTLLNCIEELHSKHKYLLDLQLVKIFTVSANTLYIIY